MMMIVKRYRSVLYGCVLGGVLLVAGACAQDSTDPGGQVPLGDVVRHQRAERRDSKATRKIVTDDDIAASSLHRTNDWVAEFVIIPAIHISGLAPNDVATERTGTKQGKIDVWFGPHLGERNWCNDSLDCAEESFLQKFQGGTWTGSKARILFDSDDEVGDYPARVAHLEVLHDVRGKMLGTVVLIQTPVAVLNATCLYPVQSRPEAEEICDAFASSLQVNVPERYIYVQHH